MTRRIVWYPDGSSVAARLAKLPQGFEAHPLSARATLSRRSDEPQALVVDVERDAAALAALGGARGVAMPVVGLVGANEPSTGWPAELSAFLPRACPPRVLASALATAMDHARLVAESARATRELEELNAIGVSLSAERDTDELLALILAKAREITRSDAGSIYLVEEADDGRRLRFKLSQNDFVQFTFSESSVPISEESVAGHVALSGEILRLEDAYAPPPGAPFRINRRFDEQVGYRTKSMLVVPMRTPPGETIGVLQLINCRPDGTERFASVEAIDRDARSYDDSSVKLAASLASQAAVALQNSRLLAESARATRELAELNKIGVSLSAERDTDALLALILAKAREITRSDAGSIYVVEKADDGRRLRFKLSQNDFVQFTLPESPVPISEESVAGHVALSGEILRLKDAYAPPPGAPFRVNRSFDQQFGYRTKSMLVVPMRTPRGETIGVLQLINCRPVGTERFASVEAIERDARPYGDRFERLAASLASQAAVALSIQLLFERFVRASVTAIEARDPTTSGHSEGVADLTVALAAAVDRRDAGRFREIRFSAAEINAIRYASLLHDFGKIGVREEVLVKARKLYPHHLDLIKQRIEIIRRGIRLRHGAARMRHLLEEGRDAYLRAVDQLDAEQAQDLAELDGYLDAVVKANEPAVMAEEVASRIQHVAARIFRDDLGAEQSVITPEEASILSIPRGSLTPGEYEQIQLHVKHTYEFLDQLPWTGGLEDVPRIARFHHEKINGAGYREGIRGDDIPVQSRMMTITDIFDALTASDRPYKAAVPIDKALEILGFERKAGAIDPDLLDIFVELRPWEKLPRWEHAARR